MLSTPPVVNTEEEMVEIRRVLEASKTSSRSSSCKVLFNRSNHEHVGTLGIHFELIADIFYRTDGAKGLKLSLY